MSAEARRVEQGLGLGFGRRESWRSPCWQGDQRTWWARGSGGEEPGSVREALTPVLSPIQKCPLMHSLK